MLLFNNSIFNLVATLVINSLGFGFVVVVPLLAQFGASSIYSWIFTSLALLSLGMIFVRLVEEESTDSIHELIIIPFSFSKLLQNFIGSFIYYSYWFYNITVICVLLYFTMGSLTSFLPKGLNKNVIDSIILFAIVSLYFLDVKRSHEFNYSLTLLVLFVVFMLPVIGLSIIQIEHIPISKEVVYNNPKTVAFATLIPYIGMDSIAVESSISPQYIRYAMIYGCIVLAIIYGLNIYSLSKFIPNTEILEKPYKILYQMINSSNWSSIFNIMIVLIGLGSVYITIDVITSQFNEEKKFFPSPINNAKGFAVLTSIAALIFLFTIQSLKKSTMLEIAGISTSIMFYIYLFAIAALIANNVIKKTFRFEDAVYITFSSIYIAILWKTIFIKSLIIAAIFGIPALAYSFLMRSNNEI